MLILLRSCHYRRVCSLEYIYAQDNVQSGRRPVGGGRFLKINNRLRSKFSLRLVQIKDSERPNYDSRIACDELAKEKLTHFMSVSSVPAFDDWKLDFSEKPLSRRAKPTQTEKMTGGCMPPAYVAYIGYEVARGEGGFV